MGSIEGKEGKCTVFLVRARQLVQREFPQRRAFLFLSITLSFVGRERPLRGCLKTACTLYAKIAFIRHFSNAT